MRKTWFRMVTSFFIVLMLAACGSGNDGGDKAASDPETIVQKNCVSCHGENLEGRNGPKLANIGSKLSKDEILQVIEEGRPGMPDNIITGDDADKVAEWLAEKK